MTPREYLTKYGFEKGEEVARKAGTTFANFKLIALYRGSVSGRLAKRLEDASEGEMTLEEILFQAEHEKKQA